MQQKHIRSRSVQAALELPTTSKASANWQLGEAQETVGWQPVAKLLKIKERAFWRLVHEQGLPHFRLNARVFRFLISDVQNWLANYRKGEA